MKTNAPKLCVPICVRRASEISDAFARAAEAADIIELRLDCLGDTEMGAATQNLLKYLDQTDLPTILTLRPSDQGGHTSWNPQARCSFWSSLVELPENCFVDLELDLIQMLAIEKVDKKLPTSGERVICSHHDFVEVPADLEEIYERMTASPARILKIAVQADDAIDCLPIFHLLQRAQREGRAMIAIAMGPAGVMTRILGPSRGSFLTYGSLDDEGTTAPGQVTAKELREVYRIDRIDQQTEIFGIVGKPVEHSLSPHIHNAAFAEARVDAVYVPFEVSDATQFMRRMVHPRSRELDWNLRGLSVTAPHKSTVMAGLDWLEPTAREIGAVNTIVIQGRELHGYNTDAEGFLAPLREKFGPLKDARCAIIGAGGAARAALWGLRNEGGRMTLFARDSRKASVVAEEFGAECTPLAGANFDRFEIVVNATPLGARDRHEDQTVSEIKQLRGVRLAYDLVYNPLETRFLREAREAGCDTLSGIEMLIAQAFEQFKLWTGTQPDVETMRTAAINGLRSNRERLKSE